MGPTGLDDPRASKQMGPLRRRVMRLRRLLVAVTAAGSAMAATALFGTTTTTAAAASYGGSSSGCANNIRLCTEVSDPLTAFGHYVGHDEPSVLFYSNVPGSGNHMR